MFNLVNNTVNDEEKVVKFEDNVKILKSGTPEQKEKVKKSISFQLPEIIEKVKAGTAKDYHKSRLLELNKTLAHLIKQYHEDKREALKLYVQTREILDDIYTTEFQQGDRIDQAKERSGEKIKRFEKHFTKAEKIKSGLNRNENYDLVKRLEALGNENLTFKKAQKLLNNANNEITELLI